MKRILAMALVLLLLSITAEASQEGISVAQRGGTWVFCIPEEIMNGKDLSAGSAPVNASEMIDLFGATLTDTFSARIACPAGEELCMCVRVIDGNACVVARPKASYGKGNPFRWQAVEVTADLFNAAASVTGVSAVNDFAPSKPSNDNEQVFQKEYDGLDITVFRHDSINIGVLHVPVKANARLRPGVVHIGALPQGIPVQGYVSEKHAIYCFVLTDAELGALVAGEAPAIDATASRPVSTATTVPLPDLRKDLPGYSGGEGN